MKVARIYCKNTEDRKDLIQDIILQLWKAYPKYDKTYSISTWTYRIAINVSISFLRKATTRNNTHSTYQQQIELLQIDDTVIDEKLEQLYHFIDLLKPIDKAIIPLFTAPFLIVIAKAFLNFSLYDYGTTWLIYYTIGSVFIATIIIFFLRRFPDKNLLESITFLNELKENEN